MKFPGSRQMYCFHEHLLREQVYKKRRLMRPVNPDSMVIDPGRLETAEDLVELEQETVAARLTLLASVRSAHCARWVSNLYHPFNRHLPGIERHHHH